MQQRGPTHDDVAETVRYGVACHDTAVGVGRYHHRNDAIRVKRVDGHETSESWFAETRHWTTDRALDPKLNKGFWLGGWTNQAY